MATLARAVRGLARPAHSRLCTRALPLRVQALSTLLPRTLSTAAAAAIDEDAEWAAAFKDATDAFSGEDSHETSAQRMRELVKSGLLRHTDLRDRPFNQLVPRLPAGDLGPRRRVRYRTFQQSQ